MKVLGILVRTRVDQVTEIGFRHAEEILQVSREFGHIFIDLAAEMAKITTARKGPNHRHRTLIQGSH